MNDRRLLIVLGLIVAAWAVLIIAGTVLVTRHLAGGMTGGGLFSKNVAGKPIPCGPEVYTQKQLDACLARHYHRYTVEVYERLGHRDPKWDALAEKLLQNASLIRSHAADAPTEEVQASLVKQLLALGCDDPMVMLCSTWVAGVGDDAHREQVLLKAVAEMKRRQYPPRCLAWAYRGLCDATGETGKKLESASFKWRPLAINAYADAACAKFEPGEQRVLWMAIYNNMEDAFRRSQADIVGSLKARPDVDPWLLQMAWGKHRYDWGVLQAGGADYILSATGKERKAYLDFMQQARVYFQKAYELHPEYPESCAYMIDIVKGLNPPGESARKWFDRAVAGQFDYNNAYYGMLDALHPWWGGSRQAQLTFAKECLDTGRFDTVVPAMYQDIVLMISGRQNETEIWADPEVWTNLQRYYDGALGYSAKADPTQVKPLRTLYALMAWRCGHSDAARTQLLALNGEIDRETFDNVWGERAELFVGSIFAKTGPNKDRVAQAEKLYDDRQVVPALAAYQELLKSEQDKHARFFIQDRLQTLGWEKQYDAGEWVHLNPTPDFVGWDPWQGTIKPLSEGNGFITYPSERSTLMVCHIRPGDWYEIKCDVEFPDRKVDGIEAGFITDISAGCANPNYDTYRVVRFPPSGFGGIGWQQRYEHALMEVPRTFPMRMVRCDRRITTYMGEQTVFQDAEIIDPGFRFEGWYNVGFGGETYPDRTQPVIYRNIQIHKMGTAPVRR